MDLKMFTGYSEGTDNFWLSFHKFDCEASMSADFEALPEHRVLFVSETGSIMSSIMGRDDGDFKTLEEGILWLVDGERAG